MFVSTQKKLFSQNRTAVEGKVQYSSESSQANAGSSALRQMAWVSAL